jgi:hypothetical protein
MEDLLSQLAVCHGRYWDLARSHPQIDWLRTFHTHMVNFSRFNGYYHLYDSGLTQTEDLLPAQLRGRKREIWECYDLSAQLSSLGPRTFLHGDPHIGNFYRLPNGRMGILDWQFPLTASWSHDVAYAMITSLDIEDRRRWERELIQHYLHKLSEAGGAPPAFDAAWQMYRGQTFHALVGWLATVGVGTQQPSARSMTVVRRAGAAVVDHDSISLVRNA